VLCLLVFLHAGGRLSMGFQGEDSVCHDDP
jgi:hypothetical protein